LVIANNFPVRFVRFASVIRIKREARLNAVLVKKPLDLLEYVVVHEMPHLIEPTHGEWFFSLLDQHIPTGREARAELNARPQADEMWTGPGWKA
jgi:predicted metal-dependent hydrolase